MSKYVHKYHSVKVTSSVKYTYFSHIYSVIDMTRVTRILASMKTKRSIKYLFKHFTIHIEHGIKTAIANECELIARSGTCHLRPAKS